MEQELKVNTGTNWHKDRHTWACHEYTYTGNQKFYNHYRNLAPRQLSNWKSKDKEVNFLSWSLTSFWGGLYMFSHEKMAPELTIAVPCSYFLQSSHDVFAMVIFTKQSYRKSTQWFLSTTNIWNLQAFKKHTLH